MFTGMVTSLIPALVAAEGATWNARGDPDALSFHT